MEKEPVRLFPVMFRVTTSELEGNLEEGIYIVAWHQSCDPTLVSYCNEGSTSFTSHSLTPSLTEHLGIMEPGPAYRELR